MHRAVAEEPLDSQNKLPDNEQFGSRVLKQTGETLGRVLIVEDEQELIDLLEFNLLRKNYQVLVATDGLEACRIVGREKPDLILLDLMLPLLDGWEICRLVRMNPDPQIAQIPIIMLSAMGTIEDRLKGYDLGADLYLSKPYAIKEVLFQSRLLIERRRSYLALADRIANLEEWHARQDLWQHALFHELGNQLTIISGMAQHLDERNLLDRDESRKYMKHIRSSSDYLGALAENYLLIRQLETHPEHLQQQVEGFQLQALVEDLRQIFSPHSEKYRCVLAFHFPEADMRLELQPLALKIILSSLLENALKYAGEGASVSLAVRVDQNRLLFEVSDNGPGISPADRERVFDKFFRGRNAGQGSGLGLYMSRTLALAMGGQLSLLEAEDSGCVFLLDLPLPH